MALQDVNWKTFLSPDCILPPDILFQIKSEDGNDGEGSTTANGAHKFLLAGVSSVFGGMFFGPMKETMEVIEVKDTTHEAFKTMISFIYSPPGEVFTLKDVQSPQRPL